MKGRKTPLRKIAVLLLAAVAAAALSVLFACGGVTLKSIEIECVKTEYYDDETFDFNSVTVTAVYSDKSKSTVAGWSVENAENLSAGEQTLTVVYVENGVTARGEIKITVSVREHEHAFGTAIKNDEIGHWYECACGERSEESGHVWKPKTEILEEADCLNGGERVVTCSVCGFVTNEKTPALGHDFSIGHNEGGVHFHECSRCDETDGGENIEYALAVTDYKKEWFIGQTFDLAGASASLKCTSCGEKTSVDIDDVTVTAEAFGEAGEDIIVVCEYGEYSFDAEVTVKEKSLTEIKVETGEGSGNKYDYAVGERFATGKLTLAYDDGSKEVIDLTEDMLVDEFDTSEIGVRTVYVDYDDKLCSFEIRVGYDAAAGAYYLTAGKGTGKIQVEDGYFVDMSGAILQPNATNKFESTANMSDGTVVPNGAEGSSTSNISVKDNKIVIRFSSTSAGKFRLGLRAQSGSGSGRQDQPINGAFRVTVNGAVATIDGIIKKASTGDKNWYDMVNWTLLEDIAGELELKKGLNEIEFYYLGETSTLRFPNIDYFTLWIYENVSLEVSGSVEISKGANYTGGLTLTVKDGDDVIKTLPVTADMISGLDSSTAGVKTVTVTYAGFTTTASITVLATQTLTVKGGTFAGGGTSVLIKEGDPLPEIIWTAQNVIAYTFNGVAYKTSEELGGLTMCGTDATVSAVTLADMKAITLPTSNRFCNDLDANGKPANNNVGANSTAGTRTKIYADNDATRYAFAVNNAAAKGVTLTGDLNFGSGKVLVFVTVKNNGSSELAGVAYGTECGAVNLGAVAAGETVTGFAVINSDNANHWTSVVWGGGQTAVDFDMAVYAYAIA